MTYNIHPILVHFPISLLFIYSIIKIIPFKKWFPKIAWRDLERLILLLGVLGAFAALATGDTAEQIARPNHQLVDAHSTFATAATWLYGFLLIGEISAIINLHTKNFSQKYSGLLKIIQFLEKLLCNRKLSALLAFIGLISITLTGLLGGVMVYGVGADPLAPIVLKILGISL